jgi:transposase
MAKKHLTDDSRNRIRVLFYDGGKTKSDIQRITGYSIGQIKRALISGTVAPRSGRPTLLSSTQEDELIAFISASKKNRRMTFLHLSLILFNATFGLYAIRATLRRRG